MVLSILQKGPLLQGTFDILEFHQQHSLACQNLKFYCVSEYSSPPKEGEGFTFFFDASTLSLAWGRIVQSETCLTADPEVTSLIQAPVLYFGGD